MKPQLIKVTYQVGFFLEPEYHYHYIDYNMPHQKQQHPSNKPAKKKK